MTDAREEAAADVRRLQTRSLMGETAGWLLLAVAAWIGTYSAIAEATMFRWGDELWPRIIVIIIFTVTVLRFVFEYFVFGVAPPQAEPGNEIPGDAAEDGSEDASHGRKIKLLSTFLLPFVYLLLLPRAGFFVTTPFFLTGYMYIFGERRLKHLIGTSLILFGIVVIVFSRYLFLALPTGYWPGFYDFSNWLLEIIT